MLYFLDALMRRKQVLEPFASKLSEEAETFNYRQFKEEQYDKLADHVRQHVNLPLIYKILTDNN